MKKCLENKMLFVSSSKKIDMVLFLVIFIILLSGSSLLRVYYSVIVTDIEIVYTSPDGKVTNLPVPQQFKKSYFAANRSTKIFFEDLNTRIDRYMTNSGLYLFYLYKTPGAKIDWVVRYSRNSMKLDNEKIIKFNENSKL